MNKALDDLKEGRSPSEPGNCDRLDNLDLWQRRVEEGWDFPKIEPMSTGAILARLNRLGIPVTAQDYRQAAQRHDSAVRLADEWTARYPLHREGRYDDDYVWMASIVLWKRLVPDRICFEQIDELMQEGYDLLEAQRTAEACDVWRQVWEWLKDKVTPERNTIAALDKAFLGFQSVSNWCQDFEMELGNAGLNEPKYCQLRTRYCREFLDTFTNVEWSIRGNFLRAEADAYWRLGEIETAEAHLEALIQEDPDWAWGYIDWSDLYWIFRDSPKDYAKGESILLRALARPHLQDRQDVLERQRDLRAERKRVRAKIAKGKRARTRQRKRPPRRRKRRQ